MSDKWLVINGNTVENIVLWDGVSEWTPGDGLTIEPYQDGVSIGSVKNEDGTFSTPPRETAPLEEPTE